VAVSTDSGLITPIVVEANQKGLSEISKNVKELAGKARTGSLKPEEYIVMELSREAHSLFQILECLALITFQPSLTLLKYIFN